MTIFHRLFGTEYGDQFPIRYWPDTELHACGDAKSFDSLRSGPLREIFEDIRAAKQLLPDQYIEAFDSVLGSHARKVDPDQATELLAQGFTIRLRRIDEHVPAVAHWLREMVEAVSGITRVRDSFANLFISPAGWRCVPHFDGHEVFVLQLFGAKTWTFAPADIVQLPSVNYELGGRAAAMLRYEVPIKDLPKEMPRDCRSVELRPGDALFLPRGYYHRTATAAKCMQLTFSLQTYNWAELATQTVFSMLMRQPRWRTLPKALFDDPTAIVAGLREIVSDLAGLVYESEQDPGRPETLCKSFFEGLVGPAGPSYWRNPYATLSLQEPHLITGKILVVQSAAEKKKVAIEETWITLIEWLCQHAGPFSLGEATVAAAPLDENTVKRVLLALSGEGIVWRTDGVRT
ncbi:MAG: cupin-like domain-containing protein [Rhodobacteraceae bacterium]|nr:cupin-like domain-containing protein [Paracoccaceae bacterium]